jgi:hypothetical protein
MFTQSIGFTRNRLLLFAVAAVVIVSLGYYFVKIKGHRPEGWVASKSTSASPKNAGESFLPGVIVNGEPPQDFEISLIEPSTNSPIIAKPSTPCSFVASVKVLESEKSKDRVPPTFVYLVIMNGSQKESSIPLDPDKKDDGTYYYKKQIVVPKNTGRYELFVEVKYSIYEHKEGGMPKRLKPFYKTVKGAILDVSN